MFRTFKYPLHPSEGQLAKLVEWDDACRFLANLSLEQWKLGMDRPKGEKKYPSFAKSCQQLTDLRKENEWLRNVPVHISQSILRRVETSWKHCFDKVSKKPRWKRKGRDVMSFTEPDPLQWELDSNRSLLSFPKLGNVRVNVHRPLEGRPMSCTLKREGSQWYACIQCELPDAKPTENTSIIGLDRGIVLLVADSDGATVANPEFLKKSLVQLRRVQRKASRKQRGSNNQKKAYQRVAKVYRRVTRQRDHYLHQVSKHYAKNHGVIGVEKLQIDNMVKIGSGLARSILDAGWGKLVNQMKYKAEWAGGKVVEVPAAYSSQECSECGCVDSKSRASQALFSCTSCGYTQNADLNAAKIIKRRTIRSLLTGEGSAPEAPRRTSKPRLRNRTQGESLTTESSKWGT